MDSNEETHEQADRRTDPVGASREHIDRRTAEQLQAERGDGARQEEEASNASDDSGLRDRLRSLGRWLQGPFHRAVTVGAVGGALILSGCTSTDAPTALDDDTARPAAAATDEEAAEEEQSEERAAASSSSVCTDDQDDQVVLQDGAPTAQAAGAEEVSDLLEARITQVDGEVRLSTRRGASTAPPTDDSRIVFHLQSTDDPADTGVVVLGFPDSPAGEFTVRTGPTPSRLSEVTTTSSRIDKVSLAAGMAAEDLPVPPPFQWFVVGAEGDLGDVCPSVTGFTKGAELPVFPQDADAAAAAADTVEVTGADYAFEGVPAEVEDGTRLAFRNSSEEEAHELVLIRLTDDTPPVEEFLRLPIQEGMAVSELVGVSIALPGEPGRVTKGDLLLDEPGRYLLLCAIPVGTPPEQLAEHPFGPPPDAPPPSSPPHLARGMTAVVEVTG